jgi:hypothetical protein
MSFNFYVSKNVALEQNTLLFVSNASVDASAHYVIDVNMGDSLNNLFSTRTYKQNELDEDDYNTILTVDHIELFSRLNTSHSNIFKGSGTNSAPGVDILGKENEFQPYYVRLLEIMALNIFGHAKARAAIENDTEFKTKVINIDDHLTNEFGTNETLRNEFFEQYIQLDRQEINQNDVNTDVNFNLHDSQISFLAFLSGIVLDTNSNGMISQILNSQVVNGLVGTDGLYNIEVLTKLNGRA